MEREIARLEAARAGLVRGYRRGPDDVRIGKGQYVAGAELDRYQRLGRELAAVQLKLDDAVSGPPSAVERPWLSERAVAERDHLAARRPGQDHALAAAERRVAEPAAAEARWRAGHAGAPPLGGDRPPAPAAAAVSAPHSEAAAGDEVAEAAATDLVATASSSVLRGHWGRRNDQALTTKDHGVQTATELDPTVSENGPDGARPVRPAGGMVRVAVTDAQAAVVGFRFLDNDDPAGIVLDGTTMAYPLERGAYIAETLEFYADQLRRNPDGLDGHRERRSTLALARRVREANAAGSVPASAAPAEPVGPAALPVAPPWGVGDTVLIADKWSPDGSPAPALVMAENPARPGVVKVKYLHSRTAAWVARSRVLGPAAAASADVQAPGEPATPPQAAGGGRELSLREVRSEVFVARGSLLGTKASQRRGEGGGRAREGSSPAVGITEETTPGALQLLDTTGPDDLLARFLNRRKPSTVEAYRKDLAYFAGWLGLPLREAVARLLACDQGQANRLLDHYAGHLRSTPPAPRSGSSAPRLSPATANRRLAAIRSLVKMARLHGLLTWTVDVEGERVEAYRETRGPGRPAVRRMLDRLDEAEGGRRPKAARDRAQLRLLWDLGLRRGELVELDLAHLDLEGGRLSLLGKGRNERAWLDLPDETLEALELWLVHRGEAPGPLFCAVAKGGRVKLNRLSGTDVYRQLRPLGERVGARARPHGVRHSAITGVLEASGGDRRLGQTFARHRDGRVTDRYDDARQDLAGKAGRLAASLL
jgi:integrase/recombinase XerC